MIVPGQRAVLALIAGMVIILLLGTATYTTDGMAYRLSAEARAFTMITAENSTAWRRGECLLLPEQNASDFADNCMPSGTHPRILVWGDSFAAALAQGFVPFANAQHYSVGWLTAASCPPFIGYVDPQRAFCKGVNDGIIQSIQKTPPDIVILHSTWCYQLPDIEQGLARTVSALRAAGVKKIILVGPISTWKKALPTSFLDFYFRNKRTFMPKYTFFRSEHASNMGADKVMQQQAAAVGVSYISALKSMCNELGCLARAGDHDQFLTSFDTGHLTAAAATEVAQKLLPDILK